jgi:hypothetical protein
MAQKRPPSHQDFVVERILRKLHPKNKIRNKKGMIASIRLVLAGGKSTTSPRRSGLITSKARDTQV